MEAFEVSPKCRHSKWHPQNSCQTRRHSKFQSVVINAANSSHIGHLSSIMTLEIIKTFLGTSWLIMTFEPSLRRRWFQAEYVFHSIGHEAQGFRSCVFWLLIQEEKHRLDYFCFPLHAKPIASTLWCGLGSKPCYFEDLPALEMQIATYRLQM